MGRLTQDQLKYILNKHDSEISTLIETGTCEGGFSSIASDVFKKVITIELNDYYYHKAKSNLGSLVNVDLIQGDSAKVLPELLKKHKEPLFIYLDAHFFNCDNAEVPLIPRSEFPLFKELKAISKRKVKDIIVVDDVHSFGRERPDLRFSDAPDWENVTTDSIVKSIGNVIDSEIIGDCFIIWK